MATEKYTRMSEDDVKKNAGMCEYESLYRAFSTCTPKFGTYHLNKGELWREAKIVAYKASHANNVGEIRCLYETYLPRYENLFLDMPEEERLKYSNRIRKDVFTYAWIMLYHMEMSNPDEETKALLALHKIVQDERPLCEGMFTLTSVTHVLGWVMEMYLMNDDCGLMAEYEYRKKKYNIKYDYNYVKGEWVDKEVEKEVKEYLANNKSIEPISVEDRMRSGLLPIFKNNEEEVEKFLKAIIDKKPVEITRMVKGLIKNGIVNRGRCNKELYDILHNNGFYRPSLSNWNNQI